MSLKIMGLVDWTRKQPLEQSSLLDTVSSNMSNNAGTFSSPPRTKAQTDAQVADFNFKYSQRFNGAHGRSEFNTAKAALNVTLHDFLDYTNEVADGSADIITLAGFTASDGARHPAPSPEQPIVKLTAHEGRMLSISLIYHGTHKGNLSFVYIVGENVEPDVQVQGAHITINSTGKVHVITDGHMLEDLQVSTSAIEVFVKVLAQNTTGKSAFSALMRTKILD